jgi:3'-phosphoadenosine 5'-phosphosulfate sulfotransferase (PAPS reductase)/FAD synthetase
MQQELFTNYIDYSNQKVLIGLSGGINSMAVLCCLALYPDELKPKELHLFYAHFDEHSPDTLPFVIAGLAYAETKFLNVIYSQTNNSVLEFFREQKMIPHPIIAPCTRALKIEPMMKYAKENGIDVDLVGYVKEESRRIRNMHKKNPETKTTKAFPIANKENEWCFQIVKKEIGWYPKIYDIKNPDGSRMFPHNNCLPCKNMQSSDFDKVKLHFPEYWQKAIDLSNELEKHWGRDKTEFYTKFGRDSLGTDTQPCEVCAFD